MAATESIESCSQFMVSASAMAIDERRECRQTCRRAQVEVLRCGQAEVAGKGQNPVITILGIAG